MWTGGRKGFYRLSIRVSFYCLRPIEVLSLTCSTYSQKTFIVPVRSGSKRIVILPAYFMAIDFNYQLFEVTFFLHKINLIGVNY